MTQPGEGARLCTPTMAIASKWTVLIHRFRPELRPVITLEPQLWIS